MKGNIITLLFLLALTVSESHGQVSPPAEKSYDEHKDKMIEFTPDDGKSSTRLHIVRDSDVRSWQRQQWDEEKKFYQQWAKRAKKIVTRFWQPPSKVQPAVTPTAVAIVTSPTLAPAAVSKPLFDAASGLVVPAALMNSTSAMRAVASQHMPMVNAHSPNQLPTPRYSPKRPWSRNLMAKLRLKGQLMAGKQGLLAKAKGHGALKRQNVLQQSALQSRSMRARFDFQKHTASVRQPASSGPVPAGTPIQAWGKAPAPRWQQWWGKVKAMAPAWMNLK